MRTAGVSGGVDKVWRFGNSRLDRIECREKSSSTRLSRDRCLARVVVIVAINFSVRCSRGVTTAIGNLNAGSGNATVGIRNLHTAHPVNSDIHKVEQVAIVWRAIADDRPGVADRYELRRIIRCRIYGHPGSAAVVGCSDIEMPDRLKVLRILVVAARGCPKECKRGAVVIAGDDFRKS